MPFHEHVFLDQHLEDFPQIEPIQQFMTLALNGISQNSFLSIQEKKEIIKWPLYFFSLKQIKFVLGVGFISIFGVY